MNRQIILKVSLIVVFALLFLYFAWDVSLKVRNSLLFQGYGIAISELVTVAEDPQCQPFPVFVDGRTIYLINVECLEQPRDLLETIDPADLE